MTKKLRAALLAAARGRGRRRIFLRVKGNRPMADPTYSGSFNTFFIEGLKKQVSVLEVCELFDIDPHLVQLAFFYYGNVERLASPSAGVDEKVAHDQYQVVTDLFPFPRIIWLRESGSEGGYRELGVFSKSETAPNLGHVYETSWRGKVATDKFIKTEK